MASLGLPVIWYACASSDSVEIFFLLLPSSSSITSFGLPSVKEQKASIFNASCLSSASSLSFFTRINSSLASTIKAKALSISPDPMLLFTSRAPIWNNKGKHEKYFFAISRQLPNTSSNGLAAKSADSSRYNLRISSLPI
ncbi:hypothetical protein D3C81_1692420 [compost metagenome]